MKPQSIRALIWFSIILLATGWFVMSPLASLLLAVIVILCGLPVVIFGSLVNCLIGAALLAAALGLVTIQYPQASLQFKAYKQRTTQPKAHQPSTPPTRQ